MQELLFVVVVSLLLAGGLIYLAKILLPKQIIKDFVCSHQLFLHPNSISYERVAVVVISFIFYDAGWQYLGIALFLLGAFLDAVDGMVARICKLVTTKGKKLDPMCDKISYIIPLYYFCILGMLPIVTMIIFIIVELTGQWFVRNILLRLDWPIEANNFGKIKAVLSFSLVPYLFILQNNSGIPDLSNHILTICVGLSACSAIFKLIPDKFYIGTLSILNLFCGISSLYLIQQNDLMGAILIIVLGQVFDLFDGRIFDRDKQNNVESIPWLDGMANFVSFGLCPMALILSIVSEGNIVFQIMAGSYLMAISYQLLRAVLIGKKGTAFNSIVFKGLPSPVAAILIFSVCLLNLPIMIIMTISVVVSLLTVSNLPFVDFGRGIAKQLPRVTIVVLGAGVFVLFAYFVKIDSSAGVGFSLLVGMFLYFIFGEISRRRILL